MTLLDFKIKHSEIIEYFQIVEEQLKIIYSIIVPGDINQTLLEIEDYKLNQIIKDLYKLDFDKSIIDGNDSLFIKNDLKVKRDYYFYKCFKEFHHSRNLEKSKKFEDVCNILESDLKQIKALQKNLKKSKTKAELIYRNKKIEIN